MNLKKTLLSAVGAGALILSTLTPLVSVAGPSTTTSGVVNVTADGAFNPYFCSGNLDFGTVPLNSTTPNPANRTVEGTVVMCYEDTLNWRPQFRAHISSSSFLKAGTGSTISAVNLEPITVYNPQQGQGNYDFKVGGATLCPDSPGARCIGDIGGMNGTSYGGTDNGQVSSGSADWAGGSLDTPQYIAYAWEGAGTGNQSSTDSRLFYGTFHAVDMELQVPQHIVSGQYVSTLKLEVTLGVAP